MASFSKSVTFFAPRQTASDPLEDVETSMRGLGNVVVLYPECRTRCVTFASSHNRRLLSVKLKNISRSKSVSIVGAGIITREENEFYTIFSSTGLDTVFPRI